MNDRDLLTILDERFRKLAENFDQRFDAIDRRFDGVDQRLDRVESEVRLAHVEIEGLRGDVRQVADGVLGANQRLHRHEAENARQFDDVRSLIRLSYAQVDQRVTALETGRGPA